MSSSPQARTVPTSRSAAADERDAAPYRTALRTTTDHPVAVGRVRAVLRNWLVEKGYDASRFDAGDPVIGPGALALHASRVDATGWQLREHHGRAVSISTVTVVDDPAAGTGWVSVHIGGPARSDGAGAVGAVGCAAAGGVPLLVNALLDGMDLYDADAELRSRPAVVGARDVDDLLEVICSGDRRLATVVAAPARDVPFDTWYETISRAMAGLPGLATTYLLEPGALRDFNVGIGTGYAIPPGGVRTYLPGIDPAVEDDAPRHRILSRKRLRGRLEDAAALLAIVPRELAARSLPRTVSTGLTFTSSAPAGAGVRSTVEPGSGPAWPAGDAPPYLDTRRAATPVPACRAAHSRPAQRVVLFGPPGPRKAPTGGQSGCAATGEPDPVTELREIVASLQETIAIQREEILDLAAELETAQDALEGERAENRGLRRRLAAGGQHEPVADADPPLPKSFGALLGRLPDLSPAVVFTGDPGQCLALDEHTQAGTWAQIAWTGLAALADYALAKREHRFDGDFASWCTAPPADRRTIAPGKIARHESAKVRTSRKFAPVRTFPVPREVDPQGRVFMRSHIRLGNSATIAPRIYFFDDAAHSGSVYVGYIGRHLANTRTAGS